MPEMRQNLALLQEVGLFTSFPLQALKLLSLVAERLDFSRGEILFEAGDDFGQAYLVLRGRLRLHGQIGGKDLTVRDYYDGDFLGSFALFGPLPAIYSLTTVTESRLLTLNRTHMQKIFEEFPQTQKLALDHFAKEVHRWEKKMINSAGETCLGHAGITIL
jgi:CRP-like cAMP-binding protein